MVKLCIVRPSEAHDRLKMAAIFDNFTNLRETLIHFYTEFQNGDTD